MEGADAGDIDPTMAGTLMHVGGDGNGVPSLAGRVWGWVVSAGGLLSRSSDPQERDGDKSAAPGAASAAPDMAGASKLDVVNRLEPGVSWLSTVWRSIAAESSALVLGGWDGAAGQAAGSANPVEGGGSKGEELEEAEAGGAAAEAEQEEEQETMGTEAVEEIAPR